MNIADWYERVNAAWPAKVPTLTAEEAPRALRRLYRFAMGRTMRAEVRITTGNRSTWPGRGAWNVNPAKGWHHLVHMVSHYAYGHQHSGERPHSKEHAKLELRIVREVVRRGYLAGALTRPPKPPKPVPPVQDIRQARTLEAIARWEAKARRAETALRKLRRRAHYYARQRGPTLNVTETP